MRKILAPSVAAMLLTMLFVFQASWAAQIYVNEARDIILRSSPSNNARILAKMSVGAPVEVLKTQGGWSYIRMEEDGKPLEGWMQSRFLGTHPARDVELEMENKSLREKSSTFQKEKSELTQQMGELQERLKSTTAELDKLRADYDSLARGSANYIKIKEDYDSVKSALASAQESVQTLVQENENLKLTGKIKWFATGALVLFIGWLIGVFMGRTQKKRRASYRF